MIRVASIMVIPIRQFRNKLVINGAAPSWKGFQLGATLIGIGGSRYSFLVGGNTSLNGDLYYPMISPTFSIPATRIRPKISAKQHQRLTPATPKLARV